MCSRYEEAYGFSSAPDSDDEDVVAEIDDDVDSDDEDVVAEIDDDVDSDDEDVVAEIDDDVDSDDEDVVAEIDDDVDSDDEDVVAEIDDDELVTDELLDAQEVMDETPGVLIEDSISSLPDDQQSPLDSTEIPDDSGDLMENELVPSVPSPPTGTVPAALAGKAPAAPVDTETKVLSDEDPLAKLVREAMQRAVDSARGEEA